MPTEDPKDASHFTLELVRDEERIELPETGFYVRARTPNGHGAVDIAHLTRESLYGWLVTGGNMRMLRITMALLGHTTDGFPAILKTGDALNDDDLPAYVHDCVKCVFLGSFAPEGERLHDLYFCARGSLAACPRTPLVSMKSTAEAIAEVFLEKVPAANEPERRRIALFVANMLGHRIAKLEESPDGWRGSCAVCGRGVLVPTQESTVVGEALEEFSKRQQRSG